jgi:hypothetical protein
VAISPAQTDRSKKPKKKTLFCQIAIWNAVLFLTSETGKQFIYLIIKVQIDVVLVLAMVNVSSFLGFLGGFVRFLGFLGSLSDFVRFPGFPGFLGFVSFLGFLGGFSFATRVQRATASCFLGCQLGHQSRV